MKIRNEKVANNKRARDGIPYILVTAWRFCFCARCPCVLASLPSRSLVWLLGLFCLCARCPCAYRFAFALACVTAWPFLPLRSLPLCACRFAFCARLCGDAFAVLWPLVCLPLCLYARLCVRVYLFAGGSPWEWSSLRVYLFGDGLASPPWWWSSWGCTSLGVDLLEGVPLWWWTFSLRVYIFAGGPPWGKWDPLWWFGQV